eukprot:172651-Amphidinium_carterae.3
MELLERTEPYNGEGTMELPPSDDNPLPGAPTIEATANRQNNSGFEAWRWRALHVAYDQGQRAQKVNMLQRIVNPTWGVNQNKSEFIKTFTTWRDEVYQYDDQMKDIGCINQNYSSITGLRESKYSKGKGK